MRGGVYPRVCGGTPQGADFHEGQYGLSPRVRGNQMKVRHDFAAKGSIPACAGEPRCGPVRS